MRRSSLRGGEINVSSDGEDVEYLECSHEEKKERDHRYAANLSRHHHHESQSPPLHYKPTVSKPKFSMKSILSVPKFEAREDEENNKIDDIKPESGFIAPTSSSALVTYARDTSDIATSDFNLESYQPQRTVITARKSFPQNNASILQSTMSSANKLELDRPAHWHASSSSNVSNNLNKNKRSRQSLPQNHFDTIQTMTTSKRKSGTRRNTETFNPIREPALLLPGSSQNISFRPSWMPKPMIQPNFPPPRASSVHQQMEEIVDTHDGFPPPPPLQQPLRQASLSHANINSPTHLISNADYSYAETTKTVLFSPESGKKTSKSKGGHLRTLLSKIGRIQETEGARMANLKEFKEGDINDPRPRAQRVVDVRVLTGTTRHCPPFLAVDASVVIIMNKQSKNAPPADNAIATSSTSFADSLSNSGGKVTLYFHPKNCLGIDINFASLPADSLKEPCVLRIYDPIVIPMIQEGENAAVNHASNATATTNAFICTDMAEIVQ